MNEAEVRHDDMKKTLKHIAYGGLYSGYPGRKESRRMARAVLERVDISLRVEAEAARKCGDA
jgi:hypothetical protein